MKKFAYLVHLPSGYRKDFSKLAAPLGMVPDLFYRSYMSSMPVNPFVWSGLTISPNATEAEGYIIMMPYTAQHLMEHQWEIQPMIEKAIKLAASKGAEIMGLGPLFSSITMGGRLLANNSYLGITNGTTYTAITIFQKIQRLLAQHKESNPTIALLGATGYVGTLVSTLLAQAETTSYQLVARNQGRLKQLAACMRQANPKIQVAYSNNLENLAGSDIIVSLASCAKNILKAQHLKKDATVLDATRPHSISKNLINLRPDVRFIDGGLVASPNLRFDRREICLPEGIAYASLAETILLANAGHCKDFSIGYPSHANAAHMLQLASKYSSLGFSHAPDHLLGKPVASPVAIEKVLQHSYPSMRPNYGI